MQDRHAVRDGLVDAVTSVMRVATGSASVRLDVMVVSDEVTDASVWAEASSSVLALSSESSTTSHPPNVVSRSLAEHGHLIPPHFFPLVWLRRAGRCTADDVLAKALDAVLPGGTVAVVSRPGDRGVDELVRHGRGDLVFRETLTPAGPDASRILVYTSTAGQPDDVEPACHFCPPMRFTLNHAAGLPGAAGILWGDNDLFVMPDLAPLVEGHLLIVTARHQLSMAFGSPELLARLQVHADRIRRLFRMSYGSGAVFLEHGAMYPHDAGSCIDHAHWHCIPALGMKYSIAGRLHDLGYRSNRIELDRLSEARFKRQSYLLVVESDQVRFFSIDDAQCQFLRLHVAEATTQGSWWWQQMYGSVESRSVFDKTLSRSLKVAHLV